MFEHYETFLFEAEFEMCPYQMKSSLHDGRVTKEANSLAWSLLRKLSLNPKAFSDTLK